MQNDKLLNCPFCGGEAEMTWQRHGFDTMIYWIFCRECGCKQVSSIHKEAVINAWNTRKPMERIVEQLEKEKEKANERAMTENSMHGHTLDFESFYGQRMAYCQAIEIVKGGVDNAGRFD